MREEEGRPFDALAVLHELAGVAEGVVNLSRDLQLEGKRAAEGIEQGGFLVLRGDGEVCQERHNRQPGIGGVEEGAGVLGQGRDVQARVVGAPEICIAFRSNQAAQQAVRPAAGAAAVERNHFLGSFIRDGGFDQLNRREQCAVVVDDVLDPVVR